MRVGDLVGKWQLVYKKIDLQAGHEVLIFANGDDTTEWVGVPTEEDLDRKVYGEVR